MVEILGTVVKLENMLTLTKKTLGIKLCFVSFQDDQNEANAELKAALIEEAELSRGEENTRDTSVNKTFSAQVLIKAHFCIYAHILLTSFPHAYLRQHATDIHSIKECPSFATEPIFKLFLHFHCHFFT